MTNIETKVIKLFRPAVSLLVLLNAQAAFAQSGDFENNEGIVSYIFSARSVTVVLVLALVGQVVYRQMVRKSNQEEAVEYSPQLSQESQLSPADKKHYDREEMSKLLKASATAPKKGSRSLEEAIRLSQMLQPALPSDAIVQEPEMQVDEFDAESMEVADHEVVAMEYEPGDVPVAQAEVMLASEDIVMESGVDEIPEIIDVEPDVQVQVESIDRENA